MHTVRGGGDSRQWSTRAVTVDGWVPQRDDSNTFAQRVLGHRVVYAVSGIKINMLKETIEVRTTYR